MIEHIASPIRIEETMTEANRLRSLANHPLFLPLYMPSLLFAFSQGMLVPIMPLYGADFGASYGLIGLLIAASTIGTLIGDIPAGRLLRRLGTKSTMVIGVAVLALGTTGLYWTPTIQLSILFQFIAGLGTALAAVSRHDYLAGRIVVQQRGRAIALFGGLGRIGRFAGPAISGIIAATYGLRAPFLLYGVINVLGLLMVIRYLNDTAPAPKTSKDAQTTGIPDAVNNMWRNLLTGGAGQIFAQATRTGWMTIIPLFGADVLGLDVQTIGLIVSIMSAVDTSMFYPAGIIMDRWGRKFAIVPSFTLQAIGMALVPLTSSAITLLGAAMVIGFGNGMGSGTMMTLGADLAPAERRGEFLGMWRFIGDAGGTSGPLAVGAVADLLALPAAAIVVAASGLSAALIFGLFIPETLERKKSTCPGQHDRDRRK